MQYIWQMCNMQKIDCILLYYHPGWKHWLVVMEHLFLRLLKKKDSGNEKKVDLKIVWSRYFLNKAGVQINVFSAICPQSNSMWDKCRLEVAPKCEHECPSICVSLVIKQGPVGGCFPHLTLKACWDRLSGHHDHEQTYAVVKHKQPLHLLLENVPLNPKRDQFLSPKAH